MGAARGFGEWSDGAEFPEGGGDFTGENQG
jgi:hypothetical protein